MRQLLNCFVKNSEGYWVASETSLFLTALGLVQYEVGYCLNNGDAMDLALALYLSKMEMGLGASEFSYQGIFVFTGNKTIH